SQPVKKPTSSFWMRIRSRTSPIRARSTRSTCVALKSIVPRSGPDFSQVRNSQHMSYWRRWVSQPQSIWLRKAIFQVHLWSGIGVGLYVLMISVTGSIVVYSNELYRVATPDPVTVSQSGPRLTEDQLKAAATRKYPGYTAAAI